MPGLDPFKTEQQPFEFVLPGERSLYGQALLMNGLVEETFSASFGFLRFLGFSGMLGIMPRLNMRFLFFLNQIPRQS